MVNLIQCLFGLENGANLDDLARDEVEYEAHWALIHSEIVSTRDIEVVLLQILFSFRAGVPLHSALTQY